jgi:hypothetical protein
MHIADLKSTLVFEYQVHNEWVAEEESHHEETNLEHLVDTIVGLFHICIFYLKRMGAVASTLCKLQYDGLL